MKINHLNESVGPRALLRLTDGVFAYCQNSAKYSKYLNYACSYKHKFFKVAFNKLPCPIGKQSDLIYDILEHYASLPIYSDLFDNYSQTPDYIERMANIVVNHLMLFVFLDQICLKMADKHVGLFILPKCLPENIDFDSPTLSFSIDADYDQIDDKCFSSFMLITNIAVGINTDLSIMQVSDLLDCKIRGNFTFFSASIPLGSTDAERDLSRKLQTAMTNISGCKYRFMSFGMPGQPEAFLKDIYQTINEDVCKISAVAKQELTAIGVYHENN